MTWQLHFAQHIGMRNHNLTQLIIPQCHDMNFYVCFFYEVFSYCSSSLPQLYWKIYQPLLSCNRFAMWGPLNEPFTCTTMNVGNMWWNHKHSHSGSRVNLSASLSFFTWWNSPIHSLAALQASLPTLNPHLPPTIPDFLIPGYFDSITFSFYTFYDSGVLTHSCTRFGCLSQNNPLVPSFSICSLISAAIQKEWQPSSWSFSA